MMCREMVPPSELVLIVRGFAQGVPTAQLARELDCDRSEWLNLRNRLQDLAFRNRDRLPRDDGVPQSLEQERTLRSLWVLLGAMGQDRLVPVITMCLGSSNQLVFQRKHRATSGRFLR